MKIATALTAVVLLGGMSACSSNADTTAHKMKNQTGFNREGLVLWLDAADPSTIIKTEDGLVSNWKDKSGKQHDAIAKGAKDCPKLIAAGMNGKPVVRFHGPEYLVTSAIRAAKGPVTIFVVSQRNKEQASNTKWQRLVSSNDPKLKVDNKGIGFCMCATHPHGLATAYPSTVYDLFDDGKAIGPVYLGRSADGGNRLQGDIAEILIFDRQFLAEDPLQSVLQYLSKKWQAKVARESQGWTRTGGLGTLPKRTSDALPLSDQQNQGQWEKYEPMWDEFNGKELDKQRWLDHNPGWKGRQPALFRPSNVTVKDGMLHLVMREENVPNAPKGYHTFTSASVQSQTKVRYGYFEIKARPMDSHGSSAFWFWGRDDQQITEIDVFEIGGGAPGFEHKYNMNQHVHRMPGLKKAWSRGGVWQSPFRLADAFHVYGFEWGKEETKYYIDGVLVRKDKNTHWHYPLNLIFDSETMPTWFGLPNKKDLPSTFSIDYVRSWKKKAE